MIFKHAMFISSIDGDTTNIVIDETGRTYLCQDDDNEVAINIDELAYIVDIARKMQQERNDEVARKELEKVFN